MSVLTLRLHRCGPELGKARSIYENKLKAIDEALKVRAKEKRTQTLDDFVSHLLDVHRRWCETCPQPGGRGDRPTTGRDPDANLSAAAGNHNSEKKNSRKHKNCVSTATQTTFDKYGLLIESKELPDIHADLVDDDDDDDGFLFEDIEDNGDFEDSSVIDEQDVDPDFIKVAPLRNNSIGDQGTEDGNPKSTTHGLPEELRVGDFHLQPNKEMETYDQHQLKGATQVSDAMQIKQERLTPDLCDGVMDEIDSTAHQRMEDDCEDEFQVESVQAGSVVVKYEDDFPEHQDDDMDTWSSMNPSTSQQLEAIPPDIHDGRTVLEKIWERPTTTQNRDMSSSEIDPQDPDAEKSTKMKSRKLVNKNFRCDLCGYCCCRRRTLYEHIRTHTGEKPYQCPMCNKRFTQKGSLNVHMRIHSGEKPFKCDWCSYRCCDKRNLQSHVRKHTGEKPYKCSVCSKRFASATDLKRHLRTHSGGKIFQCPICDKVLTQKHSLESHIRTHTEEKPYKCDYCTYRCCDRRNLQSHVRTHTGEKPYACAICNKRFTQQGSLKIHIRTHTGEKPFQCEFCSYRCCDKKNLQSHMRTHTGEKPYACPECPKRFSQKGSLNVHLRTHTGEKPFQCDFCSHRCRDKRNLQSHMRTHTGVKPFKCTVCGKRFASGTDLKRHIRTHVTMTPNQCCLSQDID